MRESGESSVATTERQPLPTAVRPTLASAAGAALFVALLIAVEWGNGHASLDLHVTTGVSDLRSTGITEVVQVVTFLGSGIWLTGVTLLTAAALLVRRQHRRAVVVLATMATSAAATIVLKSLIARPRPDALDALGAPETSFSFPSGHSLNSTVCYGVVVLMVVPLLRTAAARAAAVSAAGLLIVCIGLSRVYLGYHWATDVLAGWVLGFSILACASAGTAIWWRSRSQAVPES